MKGRGRALLLLAAARAWACARPASCCMLQVDKVTADEAEHGRCLVLTLDPAGTVLAASNTPSR